MKKIRLLQPYKKWQPGNVLGVKDSTADQMVFHGQAEYVDEHIRALKYSITAPMQAECIAPTIDEIEAAPKGVFIPEEAEEYEVPLKQTTNKKQTKK